MVAKSGEDPAQTICIHRRALHEYFIEERLEVGVVLQGWEVKSLRAHRVNIGESYVVLKNAEALWLGAHVTPLLSASTHIQPDPIRTKKLLLHRAQINKLIGKVERKGYTLIPLKLYWHKGLAKLEIGLARGKKEHDKRQSEREKEWARTKDRVVKQFVRK